MRDVLLERLSLPEAVTALKAQEHRQLAYELAVCVCLCDADGVQTPAERQFLARLKAELGGTPGTVFEPKSVFNRAVLCGALELLPQNWASMAIIPLQVKLVHGIAQAHGITNIDAGMVKEFIATAGLGLMRPVLAGKAEARGSFRSHPTSPTRGRSSAASSGFRSLLLAVCLLKGSRSR